MAGVFHYDHPPDVPIKSDQFLVDRLEGRILGGADALDFTVYSTA